jgi:hypothetical protein
MKLTGNMIFITGGGNGVEQLRCGLGATNRKRAIAWLVGPIPMP